MPRASPTMVALVAAIVGSQTLSLVRVVDDDFGGSRAVHLVADGDVILVWRSHHCAVGDLVVLPDPDWGRFAPHVVRRVQAVEGAWQRKRLGDGYSHVRRGHVFVANDEPASRAPDSSTWGPVPLSLLVGRPLAIIWPLKRTCLFTKSRSTINPPPPPLSPSKPPVRTIEM